MIQGDLFETPWCSCEPMRCEGVARCRWYAMDYQPGEAAALRKDAERYRKLRDTGAVFTARTTGLHGDKCAVFALGRPAQGLDDAVDAL